jgi:predicted RNase H-like HicB family nuclease
VAKVTVYNVDIERAGGWWAISVPALPGAFSQARHRDEVDKMARDVIAVYLDVLPDSFDITVHEAAPSDDAKTTA